MAAFINTNTASLNAQRNLNTSQSSLATSLQRLSSGLRINSAKDDAAGLAISERFTTQIRGISQAARNANDGISLAQTAEGTLGEIGNNLQRMRELAVQSRNSTNSADDRAALDTEVQQLKAEIGRVAGQANFNGTKLLDGSFTNMTFQVGANQGETISIAKIANANVASLGNWTSPTVPATSAAAAPVGAAGAGATTGTGSVTTAAFGAPTNGDGFNYDGFSVTIGGATVAVAATTGAANAADGKTAMMANLKTALDAEGISGLTIDDSVAGTLTFSNTSTTALTLAAAGGELGSDISITAGTAAGANTFSALNAGAFTVNGTSIDVGTAADAATRVNDLVTAINANVTGVIATNDNGALKLTSDSDIVIGGSGAVTEQTGMTAGTLTPTLGTAQTGFASADVKTAAGADSMILAMDAALKTVNSARADLGAIQNRFSSVIANLQTTSENLSASRSRIQDTDFASETASLTRGQILQQAGTAMLAQANSLPNGVLALLRG